MRKTQFLFFFFFFFFFSSRSLTLSLSLSLPLNVCPMSLLSSVVLRRSGVHAASLEYVLDGCDVKLSQI